MSRHPVEFVTGSGLVRAWGEEGARLLAVALEAGVPCDFHCTRGQCGRCRVSVLHGGEEGLTPPSAVEKRRLGSDVGAGARLSCQARIAGPVRVRFDFDPTAGFEW